MNKIKAAVFDLDGTLARREERGIHDYDRVGEDTVHEDIKELLIVLFEAGYDILIVTGRPDKCYNQTVSWLVHNHIPFDDIFMRKTGDFRSDGIIKPEIYYRDIEHSYDVRFWFDDRNRVVESMRGEGIRVLQVAPGDF